MQGLINLSPYCFYAIFTKTSINLNRNFKIRLLFLLLTLGFAAAALIINFTFKKEEILKFDAQKIERRLHRKEEFLKSYLTNPATFDSLTNVDNNEELAQRLIPEFTDERNICIQTFNNGKLKFWTSVRILINSDSLKEGSTFVSWKNGWYEAIKKTEGNFSVVCFIPIKSNYPYQNQYLQNNFSSDLISANNLDITTINDKQAFHIRSSEGKYLFSVKLKSALTHNFYSVVEFWACVLSIICGLIFINNLCIWIAEKGNVKTAILFLLFFITSARFISLKYSWFNNYFDIEIFNPKYYASNYLFPSIGDFLLNILIFLWFISFIYTYRFELKIVTKPLNKFFSYPVFLILGALVCIAGYQMNELFDGLVTNSNINFDVTNVLNLTWLSWLGIIIFCLTALSLYLLIESILVINDNLSINNKERLTVFIVGVVTAFMYCLLFFKNFNIFFLLFGFLVLLMGLSYYKYKKEFARSIFIATILIFAIISSLKLSEFQFLKERETRKLLVQKLESSEDPDAVLSLLNLEKEILKDKFIADYFKNPLGNHNTLTNRLQKLYLAGYLSKYEFKSYEYNDEGNVLRGDTEMPLSNFKNLAVLGSVGVSDYFYQINNTFGFQNYFALFPIKDGEQTLGTLVIELKSKRLDEVGTFPELLVDGKIKENIQLKDYSYAYYGDNRLFNQHGKYIYNLSNTTFSGKVKDIIFVNTDAYNREYSHLIYQANPHKLIVISKEVKSLLTQLASVSFLFLVLLIFIFLVFIIKWLWVSLKNYDIRFRNFRWNYLITTNRMLYKTRIQVTMVSSVVLTLIITGLITYLNISQQYREQQEESILEKVKKVSSGFDKQLVRNGVLTVDEQTLLAFNTFADLNGADLNLFDPQGNMILTTQPKIYDNGLIAPKMNSLAYVYLNKLQKAEYINKEQIGRLSFIAAYVPIRNNVDELIAYLELPYFSNERDYEDRIGIFVNALVNVYALVFVAIGFFAVFLANKITNPLTMVQKSLSETKIGRKNESIVWKRNDEIGDLIKEYNNMIGALEESAQKLARSERESAWREMAKQVAHEIKNPLTPLKLGVQLLDKSWKEKDPNFDRKFEIFSKSFIEQIESLAHIASEFSNFAKMPDTVLEEVKLHPVVEQSIDLYRQSDHTIITFKDQTTHDVLIKADKDQLLRCFNNLIKNAIEAMPEGRTGLIEFTMYCKNKNVCIEINDNGAGIPDNLREQIFTPNFTTKSSGTGLGLAFVKQALENMDGNIYFKTEGDVGTTFFITIPLVS